MNLFRSKRTELFATVIGLALLVVALVWRQSYIYERNSLRRLYLSASGGDLKSAEKLSESKSSEAQRLLTELAQNKGATADSRVAAIKILANRPALDASALGRLIQIDQPFVVRHAAVEALEHRGCDEACILTTLYAIRSIWKGAPALEASTEELFKKHGIRPDPALDAKIRADLRNKTEQDYRNLLNTNPCSTWKILKQSYPSESGFIEFIESKLSPCQ